MDEIPEPPPKDEFELKVRQYELERRRFEREDRSTWKQLPVAITAIAGVSAILFQGLGTAAAFLDRAAAKSREEAEAARNNRDFDFKGLELFISKKADLVTCSPETTQKNLDAFTLVLSEKVKPALQSLVDAGVSGCAADAQAKSETKGSGTAKDQQAYYSTIQAQAGVLAATTALSGSGSQPYRVFLQYEAAEDQLAATQVQQTLQKAGYRAPGVQKVSAAPNRYEVRYYKATDQRAAKAVADLVAQTLRLGQTPATVPLQKLYPNLPSGSIEVWFPAPSGEQPTPLPRPDPVPPIPPEPSQPAAPLTTSIRFGDTKYSIATLSTAEQAHFREAVSNAKRSGAKQVLVTSYDTGFDLVPSASTIAASRRAKLVADALTSEGVNPSLISMKWFGVSEAKNLKPAGKHLVVVEVRF